MPVHPDLDGSRMAPHRWRTITDTRTTTERGYGHEHAKERRRRLPLHNEHDPCGYCGRPLGPNRRTWHLPHNTTRTAYLPGFWHARCNIVEAAKRARAKQAQPLRAQSRRW